MIDVRDIGRDFMPERLREREEFRQPTTPQAPIAPAPGRAHPGEEELQVSIGQPTPFTPAPTAPSIPIGIPTQPPFTPVTPPGGEALGVPPPETPEGYQQYLWARQSAAMRGEPMPPPFEEWIKGWSPPSPDEISVGYPGSTQIGQEAGGIPPTVPPGGEAFPYPEQWQTATDIYGQLAGGMPGMTPEYAQQAWLPYKRQAEEAGMQAREQAGMQGMRWGTPLAGQIESIWGGAGERFGSEMERMRMQDIQGQRAAMLGAAGGLGGLGGQYAQLPLTVAQSMMGMGGAQQQMQQQELDRQREEWLRQQPEYSPYLQYQAGGATGIPTGPSMYQPSFGSQMLDLSSMLGLAGQSGLFGGGTPTSPAGGGYYPEEWGQFR